MELGVFIVLFDDLVSVNLEVFEVIIKAAWRSKLLRQVGV